MGHPLTVAEIAQYRDALELEKRAFINRVLPFLRKGLRFGARGVTGVPKGFATGMQAAAERAIHPVKGIRAGWARMNPSKELEHLTAKTRAEAVKKGLDPAQIERAVTNAQSAWGRGFMGTGLGRAGKHFAQPSGPGASGARRFFEAASRSGWTGRGNIGKYLPIGQKGMIAGFTATGIPEVVRAAKQPASPVGEGGVMEHGLGQLAGLGGMVASSGLGLLPGLALWYGAERMGGRAGRVADRLRAGADVRTAVGAPAPSEAAAQLAKIQRYYG